MKVDFRPTSESLVPQTNSSVANSAALNSEDIPKANSEYWDERPLGENSKRRQSFSGSFSRGELRRLKQLAFLFAGHFPCPHEVDEEFAAALPSQ